MAITSNQLARIALDAGALIMDVYGRDFEIAQKKDESPVTEADERAEILILGAIRALEPELPIIAEECASTGEIPEHGPRFALVDPLDGTREFISKRGEFTVNIAIIENGLPVMGVVYAPAKARLFVQESPDYAWQASANPGADVPALAARRQLKIRALPKTGLVAIASKSHRSEETDVFLQNYDVSEIIAAGSSLKFCLIAAGEADLYPRMGRTMEWDTAAGHGVVAAAGGSVLTEDGQPLVYGKKARGYDNPHFIVYGDLTPKFS